MTNDEARVALVRSLVSNCEEALAAAERERILSPATAINRAYYAAFYAASALFAAENRHFVKHEGLRSAIHRDLVLAKRLPADVAAEYDELMKARHTADYQVLVKKTSEQAGALIESARRVVEALRALLPRGAFDQ